MEKHNEILKQTRAKIHELLEDEQPSEIKNIMVSCDGSWSKRGFTANYGFVSVIEARTGFVVDYEVLSKYCKVCTVHENKGTPRDQWWPDHKKHCKRDWYGSSPAMEQEGWVRLWERSVKDCNFRYTTVISDGDCKSYTTLLEKKNHMVMNM